MPIDPSLVNAFRGFSLPQIDRARQQNALGNLDLQQQQQKVAGLMDPNASPETLARSGNVDVATALTQQKQLRQQNARQFLGSRMLAVAQSQDPVALLKQFTADPGFGAAAEEIGLPHPSKIDDFNVTPEQAKSQATDLARVLGLAVPVQLQTIQGQDGSIMQRDPTTGELKQVQPRNQSFDTILLQDRLARQRDEENRKAQADQTRIPQNYEPNPEGGVRPIPGGPADPRVAQNKPMTERDKQNTVLFNSLLNSEKDIIGLKGKPGAEDTGSLTQQLLGSTSITSVLQSDMFRRYQAAGLRWAANLLYLKSGATATPAEVQSTWKQFFPQPGDGPDTVTQKEQSRYQELESIRTTMVPNAPPLPQSAAPTQPEITATGPKGEKIVLRNGQWVNAAP